VLYPQNGDRFVTIDSVTSLHPVYTLSYDERLKVLGIPTLQLRRLQFDLIYCYKLIFGTVAGDCSDLFTLNTLSKTRGHAYKLYKPQCTRDNPNNFKNILNDVRFAKLTDAGKEFPHINNSVELFACIY